jgi:hypothetical protein
MFELATSPMMGKLLRGLRILGLVDAQQNLGALMKTVTGLPSARPSRSARGTGDRRDDLVAVDIDGDLGHHRAKLDVPDGASELVAGAELREGLLGGIGVGRGG